MPARIIICGARDYADRSHVRVVLDHVKDLRGIAAIILTESWGVDRLARDWAKREECEVIICQNVTEMFEHKPDGVVAFPGKTRTAAVLAAAKQAGVPVYRAPEPGVLRDKYALLMPGGGR